jgi:hypothetical protein
MLQAPSARAGYDRLVCRSRGGALRLEGSAWTGVGWLVRRTSDGTHTREALRIDLTWPSADVPTVDADVDLVATAAGPPRVTRQIVDEVSCRDRERITYAQRVRFTRWRFGDAEWAGTSFTARLACRYFSITARDCG